MKTPTQMMDTFVKNSAGERMQMETLWRDSLEVAHHQGVNVEKLMQVAGVSPEVEKLVVAFVRQIQGRNMLSKRIREAEAAAEENAEKLAKIQEIVGYSGPVA